jgi:hypothetical protein
MTIRNGSAPGSPQNFILHLLIHTYEKATSFEALYYTRGLEENLKQKEVAFSYDHFSGFHSVTK